MQNNETESKNNREKLIKLRAGSSKRPRKLIY